MRTRIACAASAAVLISLASPRHAGAQATTTGTAAQPDAAAIATRRQLIADATTARQANDHAHSLELAERAARIQMTPSLRLFIAQEEQALGRLAEALGNADQCGRDAEADTTLRNRQTVIDTCHSLADALRTQVGRVTISPPSPAPAGLAITVSGNSLPDSLWGVPYVVSPGSIVVEATATGYLPFRQEVRLEANGSASVQIALQARPGDRPPPPPTPVLTQRTEPDHGGGVPGFVPIGAIGVGAAGVITGVVFGVLYFNEVGRCPTNPANGMPTCANDTVRDSVRSNATTDSIVAYTAGGVGIALAAVGVALLVLSPSAESAAAQPAGSTTGTPGHADDSTPAANHEDGTTPSRRPRGRRTAPSAMVDVAPTPGGVFFGIHGTF